MFVCLVGCNYTVTRNHVQYRTETTRNEASGQWTYWNQLNTTIQVIYNRDLRTCKAYCDTRANCRLINFGKFSGICYFMVPSYPPSMDERLVQPQLTASRRYDVYKKSCGQKNGMGECAMYLQVRKVVVKKVP